MTSPTRLATGHADPYPEVIDPTVHVTPLRLDEQLAPVPVRRGAVRVSTRCVCLVCLGPAR